MTYSIGNTNAQSSPLLKLRDLSTGQKNPSTFFEVHTQYLLIRNGPIRNTSEISAIFMKSLVNIQFEFGALKLKKQ